MRVKFPAFKRWFGGVKWQCFSSATSRFFYKDEWRESHNLPASIKMGSMGELKKIPGQSNENSMNIST